MKRLINQTRLKFLEIGNESKNIVQKMYVEIMLKLSEFWFTANLFIYSYRPNILSDRPRNLLPRAGSRVSYCKSVVLWPLIEERHSVIKWTEGEFCGFFTAEMWQFWRRYVVNKAETWPLQAGSYSTYSPTCYTVRQVIQIYSFLQVFVSAYQYCTYVKIAYRYRSHLFEIPELRSIWYSSLFEVIYV